MNLTDGAAFPTPLIKHAKNKVNQKINFLHYTKQCIQYIAINNGCNKQILQLLREIRGG